MNAVPAAKREKVKHVAKHTVPPAAVPQGPLDATLQQASAATEAAFGLAQRRALYTARSDLLQTLRRIAESLDETHATTRHTAALGKALLALREADDFLPRGNALACDLDVRRIASAHRTPAAATASDGPPSLAVRRYYHFAHEQLVEAFKPAPAASVPLCGLGKLYVQIAQEPLPQLANTRAQALVFQQAAVTVNRGDWHAANELGVLLARLGRFEESAGWLMHSLRASPTAEGWHNLAVVYQHLGQDQRAAQARHTASTMGYLPARSGRPAVEWVTPGALAGAKRGPKAASKPRKATPPKKAAADGGRGLLRWLQRK